MFFRFRQIRRVQENGQHVQSNGPNDKHEEFVEAPMDLGIPPERRPPLQSQQQQRRDRQNKVNFVQRVFVTAVKRPPRAGEQVRYTQSNDDRHQCCDELEAAHEVLRGLHDAASLARNASGID
jgi:hypothetical protein